MEAQRQVFKGSPPIVKRRRAAPRCKISKI
jgi:hypothetical protein